MGNQKNVKNGIRQPETNVEGPDPVQ